MGYRWMGALHARLLAPRDGQGTVEYVALILLVAGVLGERRAGRQEHERQGDRRGDHRQAHRLDRGGRQEGADPPLSRGGGCRAYHRRRAGVRRPSSPRSPDRRLRLRGRRPHRAARAARLAAPRGLRLPRRHRALPLRRALAGRARGVLAGDRRGAPRAAASCSSSRATRRRPPRCPGCSSGCSRRRSASTSSASCARRRCRRSPRRATGASACSRRRRPSRRARTSARSTRPTRT